MSTRVWWGVLALAIFLSAWIGARALPAHAPATDDLFLSTGSSIIRVELATTTAARAQGLSGRAPLPPGEGLLFVFPRDGQYSFWMKDMRFSIDMLWIAADGTVVDMRENVAPETYPSSFTPRAPARFVLELSAGHARSSGISIGARIQGIPAGLASE